MTTSVRHVPPRVEEDTYLCVDVESDGPLPGVHSMLSFGVVAFRPASGLIGEFFCTLDVLPGATTDPNTMRWWSTQPEAWAVSRAHCEDPTSGMRRFEQWVDALQRAPVVISSPASYDFGYLHWYCYRFLGGRIPFLKFGMDIASYAAAVTGQGYAACGRSRWPARIGYTDVPNSHHPLHDARQHAQSFLALLRYQGYDAPPLVFEGD